MSAQKTETKQNFRDNLQDSEKGYRWQLYLPWRTGMLSKSLVKPLS